MSLSTYYLEYDRYVARLRRHRRCRARTRIRAIPLAMITMRKSTHGFPFLSYMKKNHFLRGIVLGVVVVVAKASY